MRELTYDDAKPNCCQDNNREWLGYYRPCDAPAAFTADVKSDDGVVRSYRFCAEHGRTLNQFRNINNIQPFVREDMTDQAQVHETPEEHSDIVGGSTAARRIGCPRSYALEQLVPKDPGNAYAREGTALHEMIAIVLDKDKDPDELLPFTFKREGSEVEGDWEFTVDEDLWFDIGQPALEAFDRFMDDIEKETGGKFEYEIETRCAMPGIDGAFGTADVIWRCGDLSGVWDWKFGRNPVNAEENKQLMFYARAAASTMPHLFGPIDGIEGNDNAGAFEQIDPKREVILSIMQPKVSEDPSEYIVTVEELEGFRRTLLAAVKTADEKGADAPVNKGKWCDYATCKAICPLWAGQTTTFGEKMAKLDALKQQQDAKTLNDITAVDKDTGEEVSVLIDVLPELLDLAASAEDWIKQVRAAAFAMLEDTPDAIDGWRLGVSSSMRRIWGVDDEEVRKFFKNRRYTLDDYAPRQLVTMPAAEKLLKRDGRAVPEEMIDKKVSTKNALVREDSSLPAPEMSSKRVKALGDKLAAMNGG